MKTILFILFAALFLLLLSHWSQAEFLIPKVGSSVVDKSTGKPGCFVDDIRLNTYNGRSQIVRRGALEALHVAAQRWYMGPSALAGSIEVEYFHVQLGEHDAAVNISGGPRMIYGSANQMVEWRGSPPDEHERDSFHVQIKVFPRIFNKRAYWIAAENRWAETAVEAVKDVVLEGLAHVERYIYEQTDPPVRLLASVRTNRDEAFCLYVPVP